MQITSNQAAPYTNYTVTGPLEFVESGYTAIKLAHRFAFSGWDGKAVGTLSWEDGVMHFEGDADETAKIFFDRLLALRGEERKRIEQSITSLAECAVELRRQVEALRDEIGHV